jgi:hypothetical protein
VRVSSAGPRSLKAPLRVAPSGLFTLIVYSLPDQRSARV